MRRRRREDDHPVNLSVVMPVYNEGATLRVIVERVRAALPDAEIVAVDDGSTDGSADILAGLKTEGLIHQSLVHPHNRGKGAALATGFAAVNGDAVVIQDADLEYNPEDYAVLLAPLRNGDADVVYGSRFLNAVRPRFRDYWHFAGNRLLTVLSNLTTGLRLTDMETCYKCFRREVLDGMAIEERAFGVEPELTAKVALGRWRVTEVGIGYERRTYEQGKKITWKDGVSALRCIVKYGVWRRLTRARVAAAGEVRAPVLAAVCLVLGGAWSGCADDPVRNAIRAGDELLAVGATDEAIAEYRLALRMGGDSVRVAMLLGHAHAAAGDVDAAVAQFRLADDPDRRHQIAAALAQLGRRALAGGQSRNMVRALEMPLEWGIEFIPRDLQGALAEHHAAEDNHALALALLLAATTGPGGDDSGDGQAGTNHNDDYLPPLGETPEELSDIGRAYEQLGGCPVAVRYFAGYLESDTGSFQDRRAVEFRQGTCLFLTARREFAAGTAVDDKSEVAAGHLAGARERLQAMIRLGTPRTLLINAHFLLGEVLMAEGRLVEARAAYEAALDANPQRTHALVREAESRLRELRSGVL